MTRAALVLALVLAAGGGHAAEPPALPLPEAPVRLAIPDVAAFDAALGGSFRTALTGEADGSDPFVNAWRQSQVGSKLDAQWQSFSADLPWTWTEIRRLQPRALAFALLDVGHLEAVLVLDTPLATLPVEPPAGETRTHPSGTYHVVAPGAADDSADPDRRMGLAWARAGGRLLLATSERALRATLDAAAAGHGFAPPLPGLASLELDVEALRKDLYFRREFLFPGGAETGRIRAALRLEAGQLVEVREGSGPEGPAVPFFELSSAAAAGWEPDSAGLLQALRAGLLEPAPALAAEPVAGLAPLPATKPAAEEDRYLVSIERPLLAPGKPAMEEGDLASWRQALAQRSPQGWGYAVGRDGGRSLVFAWPESGQAELERLCRATLERRAGRVSVVQLGDARELRVGPDLPALALRRRGGFVWLAGSARELADVPQPAASPELLRWARVDLEAARAEGARWQKAEGPADPDRIRPFSDRILGLLGWLPQTRSLSVERRRSPGGWSERVVFGAAVK